jgi:hypothetical protein
MSASQGKEVYSPVVVAQLMATIMVQNSRHTFDTARDFAAQLLAYADSHPIERESANGEQSAPQTENGELAGRA